MKKPLILLFAIILLAACERPATSTNWSPINDITTPGPTSSATISPAIIQSTQLVTPQPTAVANTATLEAATPLPALDLNKFPNPLPASMKGYELYSWQEGDNWNFTLITGTNRNKSFDELMTPDSQVSADGFVKITISGLNGIKKVLLMLPAQTDVLWSGMDLSGQVPEGTVYFTYPEKTVRDDLVNFAAKNNIKLEILVDPGK